MQIFYAPGIEGSSYKFDSTESKHIVRVLRMRRGDRVRIIDGKGNLYEGLISNPDSEACGIEITFTIKKKKKRPYSLHLAVSPLKNPERFEWMVEKCVEIGVDEITPLICRNSEKKSIKRERLQNIIISAMKQSLKANLTKLNEPRDFMEFISSEESEYKLIAHCNREIGRTGIAGIYKKGGDVTILIGPEGDFTHYEISSAATAGFTSIHLGDSRLRSETAGISACHSVYLLNQ